MLVDLGYKALPCPVARDTKKDSEIQRKIMELKKERQLLEEAEQEEVPAQQQQQQQSNTWTPACVASSTRHQSHRRGAHARGSSYYVLSLARRKILIL